MIRPNGRKWIRRLIPFMGLALLAVVLRSIDLEKAGHVFLAADKPLLALSTVLVGVEAVVKASKLQVLIASHRRCRFGPTFRVYLNGVLFGAASPGKIGDFAKVYALTRESGLRFLPSFAIVVVERAIDLASLMLMTVIGLGVLLTLGNIDPTLIVLAVVSLAFAVAFGLLLSPTVTAFALKPVHRLLLSPHRRDGLEVSFDAFYRALQKTYREPCRLVPATLLGIAGWVVVSVRAYLHATALGIDVGFRDFVLLWPIVTFSELLPISVLGLGTREYTAAHLLSKFDVPAESAVVLGLTGFVLVIVPLVFAGFVDSVVQTLRSEQSAEIDNGDGGIREQYQATEDIAGAVSKPDS